jgi:AraC-like DNA-binding protein
MKVTDYKPSPALREFVHAYKLIESDAIVNNQLLPDIHVAWAFRLQGDVKQRDSARLSTLPECTVSGLRNTMREIQYDAGARTLVVQLSAIGASHLLREPLHIFYNQTIAYTDVDHSGVEILHEQLLSEDTLTRQINTLEVYLLSRFNGHTIDPVIRESIRRITQSRGLVRIKALSSDLCLSQDAFEKRFRKAVGASPKQYANIVRMRAVVESQPSDLGQIVHDFDFYDPAHFSKSFKLFTGRTPSEFFRAPLFW